MQKLTFDKLTPNIQEVVTQQTGFVNQIERADFPQEISMYVNLQREKVVESVECLPADGNFIPATMVFELWKSAAGRKRYVFKHIVPEYS